MDDFTFDEQITKFDLDEISAKLELPTDRPADVVNKIRAARASTGYKSDFYHELNLIMEIYLAEPIRPIDEYLAGRGINSQFIRTVLTCELSYDNIREFMKQVKLYIEHNYSHWYDFATIREQFTEQNPQLSDMLEHFLEQSNSTEFATKQDLVALLEYCDIPLLLLFASDAELKIIESCIEYYKKNLQES